MHRRKSSQEDPNDDPIVDQNSRPPPELSLPPQDLSIPPSPTRSRVRSAPHSLLPLGSGVPARGTLNIPPSLAADIPVRRTPSVSLNSPPTSPLRTSFGSHNNAAHHARTRSISSGPFAPPVSSPLASSFPAHIPLHPFPTSGTPEIHVSDVDGRIPPGHTRRHSRLHSRNLSFFFPRPHATISEDERPADEEAPLPSPDPILIPASQSDGMVGPGVGAGHELDTGFTFGGLPKSNSEPASIRTSISGITSRRGHHHKHSRSHNFFSFLEPGQPPTLEIPAREENLQTAPTPAPVSAWTPDSTTELISRSESKSSAASSSSLIPAPQTSNGDVPLESKNVSSTGTTAMITASVQFALGALLWTRGQSIGSLACTGLGYWVVFDALGVAGPVIIARQTKKGNAMYGPARRGTTLLFAQCVYLMFAGVYVAKEAVEHLLLSVGGDTHSHGHGSGAVRGSGDGHHHHWGDEMPETLGLRFPVLLICLVLLSLVGTSAMFGQHEVLVSITNKHIPSPLSFFRRGYQAPPPTEPHQAGVQRILRNPYALPPILFCLAILGAEMVLDVAHYAPFDLALAALEVIVTAHVAFSACVVLGGVLLQTAPPMISPGLNKGGLMVPVGVSGPAGRMEGFWRAVREIERHEHVVHLPAPHVWQVVPAGQPRSLDAQTSQNGSVDPHAHANGHGHDHHHDRDSHAHDHLSDHSKHTLSALRTTSPALIITLSPQVRASLPDSDVLALTKWASSRMLGAFARSNCGKDGECEEVEVTVGVVRV